MAVFLNNHIFFECGSAHISPADPLTLHHNIQELGGCTVLAYTQQESCERLNQALRESRRIKWSEPLTFEAILQHHAATVHRVAHDYGLETSIYSQSNILYMPHDHARKLRLKWVHTRIGMIY
jgi:hypothetical protein